MKLSIIVPCYNEEQNLELLLESIDNSMKRDDIEVVLVDNGSTDGSKEVLEKIAPQYSYVKIETVKENQGYGFGILSGLRAATGEYLGWMHGDLQTPFVNVILALELIEKFDNPHNVFVKGWRKERSIFDKFFSFGMGVFETILLRTKMQEINAQPNIFHKSFFEKWQNPPNDFSLDLYVFYLAKKLKLDIFRIPVFFPERKFGESKWNTSFAMKWKFIKRTLSYSMVLRKKLK